MPPRSRRDAALSGAAGIAAVVACLAFDPTETVELLRARLYDRLLAAVAPARPGEARVVVVDIDSASLERWGAWPWRRERIARLIEAARAAGAAAIGVDILFATPDSQSPAALARMLAETTGDLRAQQIGEGLADDDARLAEALKAGGVALGFALDPDGGGDAPTTPTLVRAAIDLGGVWSGDGGVYPLASLAKVSALGLSSLPGDADGVVRRAPLFASIGGVLKPGLALETLRLALGGSAYVLEASPARATSGKISVHLSPDGMLRLAPAPQGVETVSAAAALHQGGAPNLNGAVVFIGASAPEAGGLRATGDDPLTASVTIQARAARQILVGFAPSEIDPRMAWSLGAVLGAILVGLAIFAPAPVAYAAAAIALAAPFPAALWAASAAKLFDPVEASAPALAGFAAAAAVMGAAARRRARRLRTRFERHLAPSVIQRIVANEDEPKLGGERREITALFTDIEGFTGMVARAEPEALVAALDGYFEGITRIGLAHGGMIDKFVGDAAHIFFNMPFDLADHPTKALDCAIEMVRWTLAYQREPGPAALGFGRTRIGIESGPALVGDVGGGGKLDYTAHGETVNAAARLEQANKITGSAICVGPGAAARIAPEKLRPVGALELRGFSAPFPAASPWPEGATAEWRARYLEAYAERETQPAEAARAFAALAAELDDPVAERLAGG
jgi:adenylate cyclase